MSSRIGPAEAIVAGANVSIILALSLEREHQSTPDFEGAIDAALID